MFFRKRKETVSVSAFAKGNVMDLESVPDPVFAQKMMGEGFAIDIEDGKIIAPVSGVITMIFPTKHAIGITTKEGVECLLHLGLDTVSLKGEGFTVLVSEGQMVKQGDHILTLDLETIRSHGKSLVSPFIVTSGQKISRTKSQDAIAIIEI